LAQCKKSLGASAHNFKAFVIQLNGKMTNHFTANYTWAHLQSTPIEKQHD